MKHSVTVIDVLVNPNTNSNIHRINGLNEQMQLQLLLLQTQQVSYS